MAIVITSILFIIIGLTLGGGGLWLVTLGGSVFYLFAGLMFLITAGLLLMRKAVALWVYAVLVVAALAWAIWEVGFDWWQLGPRGGMRVAAAKQPGTDEIDSKADHRDGDRLGKTDRHRICKAQPAFPGHQQGDQRKDDGAGEAGEITELAGAEGETRIARLLAGKEIGERRNQKRAGMTITFSPAAAALAISSPSQANCSSLSAPFHGWAFLSPLACRSASIFAARAR